MPPKANKKEPKTENPAPPVQADQKKSGKACLTCGIIAAVVAVLLIVGFIALNLLRFWFPPTFLFGIFSQFAGTESISSDNSMKGDASGETCSPEYMQSLSEKIQAGGADSQTAKKALEKCLNTDWLEKLCASDPVKLRRAYFEDRISAAKKIDLKIAEKIELLMNECQARYRFQGKGTDPASSGGVTIFSSLDANVCGYVDDEWTGKQIYKITAGPGSSHAFEGTAEFKLPSNGGQFLGTSRGENAMSIAGQGVAIPDFDFGFTGNFDGAKTITDLNLYPKTVIPSVAIELTEKPCVPLAPLPGGSSR